MHIHTYGAISFRNTCFVNQMLEGSAAGASEQTEPPLRDSSFTQKSIPSQWDFRSKSTPVLQVGIHAKDLGVGAGEMAPPTV